MPGSRWYESTAGGAAAEAIHCCGVQAIRAISAGDRERALALLEDWDQRIDTTPLSAPALFSIQAALADAEGALRTERPEDAQAFIQAALSMLGSPPGSA